MKSDKAEVDISTSVEVRLECAMCGKPLSVVEYYRPSAGANRGDFMIYVDPCEYCIELAVKEAIS